MATIVAIYSYGYMEDARGIGKFYALLMFMTGGMVGVILSQDVFSMYIAFETMAMASYALVTYDTEKWEPVEAGMKYLLISSTGTMLGVLGVAFLFASAGTVDMAELAKMGLSARDPMNLLAMVLIIVGFGVKAAMAPMHMWLPDAHTAAPSGISAMLSGIVVPVGLLATIKVLVSAFAVEHKLVGTVLLAMAALTMLVGNFSALAQTDIKRMLAYSSVAQTGYMLMGFGFGFRDGSMAGFQGALFHMVTNAAMKGLAFLSVGVLIIAAGSRDFDAISGTGKKHLVAGATFTVACLSLAGMPPLAGFMSKLQIYRSGFEAGDSVGYLMSILAIAMSLLSLGYYLPAIAKVFGADLGRVSEAVKEHARHALAGVNSIAMYVPLVVLALATLALGVWPGTPFDDAAYMVVQTVKAFKP
jgi:proton-translocating NADH-quinone oxidoreductase chain N